MNVYADFLCKFQSGHIILWITIFMCIIFFKEINQIYYNGSIF
jgi:hypothetical protein